MRPEINESQFALGANMEFESGNWSYPIISPVILPTRRKEKYGGFDMEGEIKDGTRIKPLFVQYKASEHMVGNSDYRNYFPNEHYRFRIRNHRQHNTLTKVSDYHQHTYYVAPLFDTLDDYKDYHQKNTILDNSVFATCDGLPGMDASERHTIGFTQNKTLFFSEPTQIESKIGFEDVLSEIAEEKSDFLSVNKLQDSSTQLLEEISDQYESGIEIPDPELNDFGWLAELQYKFHSLGIALIYVVDGVIKIWKARFEQYS
jgi:hypothetical protein